MSKLAVGGGTPVRTKPFPQWPIYGKEEEEAILRVIRSGVWGLGDSDEIPSFERRFAEYQGARYGVTCCNGTVALRIALLAMEICAGDEVIVPAYTFLATATAVLESNATPVFVDIEPDTYNLDPKLIEAAVTPRTKAIIPVHFAGCAANMDAIMEIAERRNLIVIEDAAHAHGGQYKGRGLGSIGHMGCFSFQGSKNLNCGEGGFITTNDKHLYDMCESIHNCGRWADGPWYAHQFMSGNYRLTTIQAALLSAQLNRLPEQVALRETNAAYLSKRLCEIPGITPQARSSDETRKVYHLYLFRFDEEAFGLPRERFAEAMRAEGIPAGEGYPIPLYRQPIFAEGRFGPFTACLQARPGLDYKHWSNPVCERACASEGMWIFHSVLLGTREDMDDVATAFQKVYENRGELA